MPLQELEVLAWGVGGTAIWDAERLTLATSPRCCFGFSFRHNLSFGTGFGLNFGLSFWQCSRYASCQTQGCWLWQSPVGVVDYTSMLCFHCWVVMGDWHDWLY